MWTYNKDDQLTKNETVGAIQIHFINADIAKFSPTQVSKVQKFQ